MKASFTRPALIGGLVGGVLSALPIIAGANLCCCLWLVSGGLVAAYVLQQNQVEPITQGDGALVGLLAGVAGAFVYLVVSIPVSLMMAPMERLMFERLAETMRDMPPEFRRLAGTQALGTVRILVGFLFILVLGAVFSTLGGLLGAVFFAKKPQSGGTTAPPSPLAPPPTP
jgi:hypothetical protein